MLRTKLRAFQTTRARAQRETDERARFIPWHVSFSRAKIAWIVFSI